VRQRAADEKRVEATIRTTPKDATQWSIRTMAALLLPFGFLLA
jgi:uncharacterized protein YceK